MVFQRMPLEEWFDKYQFEAEYDIGESGVEVQTFQSIGVDLKDLQLRYGYHAGKPELRQLIAEGYEDLSEDNIAVTTGASEANFAIVASLVEGNDHMIVEHPNYPSNYEVPRSLDRETDLLTLSFDEGFKPNLKKLEGLIKDDTRLISLTHPNNPTGSTISKKMLEELIRIAESKDIYLVLDETYRELSEDAPPPAATLSNKAISVTSMSKVYGLPGVRIGWVAAEKTIVDSIRAVREQVTICNSAIGEEIALAALKRRNEYLHALKEKIASNYQVLREWMARQKYFEWVAPEGGVVGFPRLKENKSTDTLCKVLLEKYKTFTAPGSCFGMDRHLRIGFGCRHESLKQGLIRMDQALEDDASDTNLN